MCSQQGYEVSEEENEKFKEKTCLGQREGKKNRLKGQGIREGLRTG